MIKKQDTVSYNEKKSFEHLLNDFLQDKTSCPESSLCTFSHKGCTYIVPEHERNSLPTEFSGLRFSWGKQSFVPGQGEAARFFVGPEAGEPAGFSLYMEETICSDDDASCPTAFYIYREGEPEPLAECQEKQITGYGSQNDFSALKSPLTPGCYFLLADGLTDDGENAVFQPLGNYLYLPFRVMESGETLKHPVVKAVEVSRPQEELADGPYTSGIVRMSVCFSAPLPVHREFSALCFTQDWRLLSQDVRLFTGHRSEKSSLHFRFRSELIWMPGRYTVILTHNREPFAAVVFEYDGMPEAAVSWQALTQTDAEYLWGKYLATDKDWKCIQNFVGMGKLRLRLADLARQSSYNDCCEALCLPELRENIYAAVLSEEPFYAKRLAYCLPLLLHYCTTGRKQVDCAEWLENNSPEDWLEERSGLAVTLYNIQVLCTDRGRDLLERLEEAVEDTFRFWALTLCGTEQEVEQVLSCSPLLARAIRPEYRFGLEQPSVAEVVHSFQQALEETEYRLETAAQDELARQAVEYYEVLGLWQKDDYTRFVLKGLLGRVKQRVRRNYVPGSKPERSGLIRVKAEDVVIGEWLQNQGVVQDFASESKMLRRVFEESKKELDAMVGLSDLKEALHTTFCRMLFNEQRRWMGLPVEDEGIHHVVFTGNPGTGKTTVARLLGKIYHALGLLSKGEVITTERRELVGEYIGETENKMNALFQRARGQVLFIDEAYSLCTDSSDRRDFGHHIIESLLPMLTKPNPDMLVVLAGYPEEMERMLQSNPGLKSRFPYHFHFADYGADELMQIARNTLEREVYVLVPEAEVLLRQAVEEALEHKDRHFANARWIKTFLVSGVLPAMARRVMQAGSAATVELYRNITRADVEEAMRTQVKVRASGTALPRRIGFRA